MCVTSSDNIGGTTNGRYATHHSSFHVRRCVGCVSDFLHMTSKRSLNFTDRLYDHISMGTRKKARLDAQADNNQNGSVNNTNSDGANTPSSSTTAVDATETPPSQSEAAQGGNAPQNISQEDEVDEPRTASSKSGRWYSSSWKSKAPAMTRVNTESVASPEQRKAESSDNSKQVVPTSPRRYMTSEGRRSSKSLPLAASTTILNVTSNKASDSRTQEGREDGDIKMKEPPLPPDPIKTHDGKVEGGKIDKDQPDKASKEPPKAAVSTWRGWWSKPDPGTVEEATEKSKSEELDNAREDAKQIPLPESPDVTRKSDPMAIAGRVEVPAPAPADGLDTKDGAVEGATSASQNRSSWFAFWSKAENAKSDPPPDEHHNQEPAPVTDTQSDSGPAVKVTPASEPATPSEDKDHAREVPQKSSGWAFWSREKPKSDAASDTESTHKQVGEIAVADTPSQSNPEAAQFNEHKDTAEKKPKKEHPKPLKRGRGLLKGSGSVSVSAPVTPTKGTPSGSPTRISTETLSTQPEAQPPTLSQAQKKPALQAKAAAIKEPRPKNILIPEFQSTYQLTQTPTYWEQLRRFFLGTGQEAPRVCIEPSPPRIRRALAIGVHGFFPAATFRFVLGQPTGTSIRFANFAAQAIKEWVEQHGNYDCEIEKVALEGEGFIADRVDTLWKLLLNWFDQIRRADFILVAAHSQGVPVAVMLVAKLIQFGCIGANARIGICAMAGVNMGPFIEYKTSLFGSTANELFEFTKPDSKVSLMYEEALDVILGHGVRITFVGSIDDQLVSIEVCPSNLFHIIQETFAN